MQFRCGQFIAQLSMGSALLDIAIKGDHPGNLSLAVACKVAAFGGGENEDINIEFCEYFSDQIVAAREI